MTKISCQWNVLHLWKEEGAESSFSPPCMEKESLFRQHRALQGPRQGGASPTVLVDVSFKHGPLRDALFWQTYNAGVMLQFLGASQWHSIRRQREADRLQFVPGFLVQVLKWRESKPFCIYPERNPPKYNTVSYNLAGAALVIYQ